MALTLDELVKKYKAGTMTDADLKESGYKMYQVEGYAKKNENIAFISGTHAYHLGAINSAEGYELRFEYDDLDNKFVTFDKLEHYRPLVTLSQEYSVLVNPQELDISEIEFQGKVFSMHPTNGQIGQIERPNGRKINFETKDLDPSFQGNITKGTAVKFKLGINSFDKPCAIEIRPI